MKRSRLLNFLVAAAFGATLATPPMSVADDTEIYLGSTATQQGVRPNVLFILDTSGSMSENIDSNGDRMDHMKDAFFEIMDNVNNINVGLMRFTDPGGPVLWPISFVDEDVEVVEGTTSVGVDVNVRVEDDADDAEETVSTGAVDTSSPDLNLVDTITGGNTTVTSADDPGLRVTSQANNAEEDGDDDIITANQIDMNGIQTNAVRFSSVPIPPTATITSANIVYTSRGGNSGSPTYVIRGESSVTPATFPTSCTDCSAVTSRTRTTSSVTWAPNAWSSNEKSSDTTTDDLSAIVQEIIGLPGWTSGNAMVFITEPSTTGGSRGAYSFNGSGGTANRRAELVVTFIDGAATLEPQLVGMRFNDVAIPQGATINSAIIEFSPSETLTAEINVNIVGELADDATAFTTANGDLTGRPKTATVVNWVDANWNDLDVVHQTTDISTIIQEIVDQPGWCGNNSLALFIQQAAANGPLNAFSFDGDQSRAPILRVDVDTTSIDPNACINSIVSSQVFVSSDDAEENISTGGISLGGSSFDMRSTQINGMRFQDIPIKQGATVVEAMLRFKARSVDTGASTLTFRAEAIDDAPGFTSANSNISDRSTGTASVAWAAPDFDTVGDIIETVDLTPVIQEVFNRSGWAEFNSLVIIQSHTSGTERQARSFDHNPVDAPELIIKVQGADATATFTVRSKLQQIVDAFDHNGFTPIVDTLYEAGLYYGGHDVDWGAQRGFGNASGNPACSDPPHRCNGTGSNDTVRRNTRVSHPSSWTGGTISKPAGCTDDNLNSSACIGEVVTGNPTYVSPIEESCQANYIVLLTDGFANHNDSVPQIQSQFGITCAGGATANDTCAVELAGHLATEDQIPGLAGDQSVITYTIGFGDPTEFDGDFLGDIATAGGGEFFTAVSGAELAEVFQLIIADILNRSTSFATPSLSVNAFNKLFDLDDVYFSLFIPDSRIAWRGNVKRYRICSEVSEGCELGEVLDATGASAISEIDSRIQDTALSFWSSAVDGAEIEVGGAAEQIPDPDNRQVFTFTDLTDPISNPVDEDLSLAVNRVSDTDDDGILDGIDGHPDHPDPLADTQFLLGDDIATLSAAQRNNLIEWILGRDVDDEDEDGDTTERRFVFSDPLHSSPVAITFGGNAVTPVIKLFVGTNDGGIQMLNAETGIEEWVFYPQDMMRIQQDLRINSNGDHRYGIDGVPAPWIFDANQDGIIDDSEGDFVRIIVGQRRGGSNYYALDVTPNTPVSSDPTTTGEVLPTLMWRINGGTGDYPNLGQTWSRPVVTTIRVGNATAGETELQDVIVFTGGYEEGQDNGFYGPSSPANAIYIADAATGDMLFTLSSDDPGGLGADEFLEVPDMNCPIPSDISVFDSNGDGTADRMYVGDTCGQVFRVDILPNLAGGFAGITAVVGKFAELSESDTDPSFVEDHRKIFFRPDIVQVLNTEFTTTARYDLVVVVTGRRDNPLNIDVQDRAYALREFHVEPLTDLNLDGFADAGTYTTIIGPTTSDAGTLFDATTLVTDPEGADLVELQTSDGWFIDLEGTGEKSLAAPVILAGKLFFTTYLPEGVVDASSCSLAEGSGQLYAVDVLTGGVVLNFDDADGTENLTLSDKTYTLGAGIPSSAVPIFQEEGITLLVGGGGGATSINPNIELPRGRTYWYEQ